MKPTEHIAAAIVEVQKHRSPWQEQLLKELVSIQGALHFHETYKGSANEFPITAPEVIMAAGKFDFADPEIDADGRVI